MIKALGALADFLGPVVGLALVLVVACVFKIVRWQTSGNGCESGENERRPYAGSGKAKVGKQKSTRKKGR